MRIHKKHIFYSIAGIIALAALFSTILFIVARHIDINARTNQVIGELSLKINGHIAFQAVELKIFPLPCLSLDGVSLSLPEKADVIIRQVRIYPKISSLLRGKFKPATAKLDFPRSIVDIALIAHEKNDKGDPLSAKTIMGRIHEYPEILAKKLPDIRIISSQGSIDIIKDDRQVFWISAMNADIRISTGKIRIAVDCRSSLWQMARFDISMSPNTRKSEGRIHIEDLRFENVSDNFISFAALPVSSLRTNFHLNFNTRGSGSFSGAMQGSIPELIIPAKKGGPVALSCNRFKGDFKVTGNLIHVTVDKLSMAHPQAELSGHFDWNKEEPQALLEIDGSIKDVASAREASLALVGRFKTTQRLFDIIRDGTVPHISFKAMAESPKNFKKTENIILKGGMKSGKIITPGSKLELEDVSGDVVLSKGILQGMNIRARLGNSYGREGNFSIGMIGPNASLFVETRVDADLSQLPPILARLIHNDAFCHEMDMLKNITGSATGKLVLTGQRNAVKPRVEVDDFTVRLDYLRTPFSIHLKSGKFLYDNKHINLSGISGSMGQSSISNLTATFHWRDIPMFNTTADGIILVADEIYPLVTASPDLPYASSSVDAVHGEILLSRTEIKGPLFHPDQWQFALSGKTENLEIKTRHLPDTAVHVQGLLKATHERLAFSSAVFSYDDTELDGSCEVIDYLHTIKKITADLNGKINPRILHSVLSKINLPLNIPTNAPWRITHGKITWSSWDKTRFEGSFTVPNGPDIFLDFCRTEKELFIKQIHVKDDDSDATIAVHQKGGKYDIRFNGRLSPVSLEHFFNRPPLVVGDFQLDIDPRLPGNAVFSGQAEIYNLNLSQYVNFPVIIDSALATGENGNPIIRASGKMNDGENFIINGGLLHDKKGLSGRFDITFEYLDLNAFINHIRQVQREGKQEDRDRFYGFNATWNLNITADRMDFGKYSWAPVHAAVNIFPDNIHVDITDARLCDINTPGTIILKPDGMQLHIQPNAEKSLLENIVPCAGGKSGLIQGNADITGTISSQGSYDRIWSALNGDFKLFAQQGRIHRFGLMAKIFSILNITEIFRGTLPDLTREGFKYRSIEVAGTISGEKIIITKAVIDGDAMDMLFKGELNIKAGTMDITLLVAPLKTVDFIVKKTPIVNDILDGSLVTIAIDIKGDFSNPELTPLPPSAIGGGLLKIMENTLKLPIKIIQPVIEQKKEEDNGDKNS